MVEPTYVPVLPVRPRAWAAYEALDPRVRRRTEPLWTLTPHHGPERPRDERYDLDPNDDPAELERWLTPKVDRLVEATDSMPGWLDAVHVESRVRGSAAALWRLASRCNLRLVTGPERDPTLQRHTADLAFLGGRGLGIRLLVDEPPEEHSAACLLDMVDRLCLQPSTTDLILDMGAVAFGDESVKSAIAAVDVLGTLRRWRTVVLVAGAFPRSPEDGPGAPGMYAVPRHDHHLHGSVHAARPSLPRSVVYGDYSVEHAGAAGIPPLAHRYGPPSGLFRYTTPDSFLIARAPLRGGPDRADRVRAAARSMTEAGPFRGAGYSEGEQWMQKCAEEEGPKGSGNAEMWIKMGHIQHMTFVVRDGIGRM
ncbi:hypothetical protein ACIQAC_00685 [Streptomyces sp. NPDC088387]|uniref:beta family protein n=1 Tax=Streptomyces sp. NPDC088387 TaxID=3365859 RepID=UPI003823F248